MQSQFFTAVYLLAAISLGLAAGPAQAELFGLFFDGSGNDFLGVIDPTTGEITTRGSVLDVGGRISGVSDADPDTGRFFFVAAEGAASDMSIWSVDVATGDPVDVHPIAMTGFSTPPLCLRWDPVHERLLAILSKTNGDEVLATINPATGASAAIGTGFATGGLSSGVCAFDSVNQRLYLPANLGMTGQRALFDVDTNTGTLLGAPLITTGLPVVDTTPGFLDYDAAGARVLGIVHLVPSTAGKVLVSIDITTGALTILGDAIPAGGFASGVSAFHQPGRDFYFLANDLATNTLNSVFGVDANGAVIADEVLRSDFVGLVLSSSFLVVVPEPGGVALGIAALAALRLLGYSRRTRRVRGASTDPRSFFRCSPARSVAPLESVAGRVRALGRAPSDSVSLARPSARSA